MCTYYTDGDGDGFGDPDSAWEDTCGAPALELGGDCDDANENVHPDAYELCNGRDDDCDGGVDLEAEDAERWYRDGDLDGWGSDDESIRSCTQPEGFVAQPGDCDDSLFEANPAGVEVCNEIDDDCNGTIDDDPADPLVFYADVDIDGFGDPGVWAEACAAPSGFVHNAEDCFDENPDANPDQTAFFTTDRGDGSWDWDCDGDTTFEVPDFGRCNWSSSSCTLAVSGWWEWSIPSCGEPGDLLTNCSGSWVCSEQTTSATQACR